MKRLVPLIALVGVLTATAPAGANHAWANYHWGRTANPFTVKIVDSVTGVWDSLLGPVSSDWHASSVLNTTIEAGATGPLEQLLCNPIAGKIRACSFNYGPNLWFGLAQIWLSGNHITQAITQVNDYYFTGSYGNNVARRHVLCQEIGHDFGLDHQYTEPSCMDDTNSRLNIASYQSPGAHDYAQLQTIYSHTDSVNTPRTAGPRLPSVTIQEVGDQTLITYIYWAV